MIIACVVRRRVIACVNSVHVMKGVCVLIKNPPSVCWKGVDCNHHLELLYGVCDAGGPLIIAAQHFLNLLVLTT